MVRGVVVTSMCHYKRLFMEVQAAPPPPIPRVDRAEKVQI